MDVIMAVIERWKLNAGVLEAYGAQNEATALRKCATEMETAIVEWQLQPLTLKEAEQESGYSYSALQQMVAEGTVENAGAKNKPRIRRCDLPRRPGQRSVSQAWRHGDLADQVLAAG